MNSPQAKECLEEEAWPSAALRRAGIEHPYQVLLWVPRTYRDYSRVTHASEGLRRHLGKKVLLKMVVTKPAATVMNNMTRQPAQGRFGLSAVDDSGAEHNLMIFGELRRSPWMRLTYNSTFYVEATVGEYKGSLQLRSPTLVPFHRVGKFHPVYAGKTGVIGADAVERAARYAIDVPRAVEDACITIRQSFAGADEEKILASAKLGGSLELIIKNLHNPMSKEMGEWAQQAAKMLAVANIKHSAEKIGERPLRIQSSIRIDKTEVDLAIRKLPYPPTGGSGLKNRQSSRS